MRFHSRRQPPSYLNRRTQMRLLRMLGLLVLVMVAIKLAANPDFWAWMFPDEAAESEQESADRRTASPEIDFKVRLDEGSELKADEFLSPAADGSVEGAIAEAGEAPDYDLYVDPRLLAPVRDNMMNVRRDELEAYYALLAKARDLPAGEMERAADPDVSFAGLMQHPRQYRGRLITVRGEVKRLLPFTAGKNDFGMEDLWEAWLLTSDSGNNPYRIVCTEIPPGIPRGEKIEQTVSVRITGYFFKKQGYESVGGLHTAPLVLAKTVRWFPPQPAAETSNGLGAAPYVVGVVCLIAGALAFMCWRLSARDRVSQTNYFHQFNEPSPEVFDAMRELETTDVNDMLREMSATTLRAVPGPAGVSKPAAESKSAGDGPA